MTHDFEPAIVITTRIVPARRIDDFRDWADALDRSAAAAPGYRSGLRLEQAGGLFHLIHHFDRSTDRAMWLGSAGYRQLQTAGSSFPVERRQCVEGRVARLVVPGESAASRSRSFVTTWLAVFPILLALSTLVRLVAPDVPQPVQLLFSSLMLTGLLQFIIMPRVQRFARPWTLADPDGHARTGST